MTIFDVEIGALTGGPADLSRYRDHAVLVVNTASRCGLTPQLAALQELWDTYRDRGLVVLGVPCNQFGAQEPGTAGDIDEFCQVNYGVSFPLTDKTDVNGPNRHPLYAQLVETTDESGYSGDVRWNFEKFLVGGDGAVLGRFAPTVTPDDAGLIAAVEKSLPR
jgi:glutathione peroxidase